MIAPETRRYTARWLLVLWGLICLSNVVFRHAHRLPDGRLVSHVHPYAGFNLKCPFPNHHHTQAELTWLDCIGNTLFDALMPDIACPLPTSWLTCQLPFACADTKGRLHFIDYYLRGPPPSIGCV